MQFKNHEMWINKYNINVVVAINNFTHQDGLYKALTACNTFTKSVCKYFWLL